MPEIISSSRRPEAPKEVRERLDDAHRPQGLTIIKAPNPFKTIKTVTSTLPQKRHISGESSQDGRIRGLGSLQVGRPLLIGGAAFLKPERLPFLTLFQGQAVRF